MKSNITKHILIRLSISIVLLLLLHFSQVDYSINAKLVAMGFQDNLTFFIGSIILFAWLIYLINEVINLFKKKLKWYAIWDIVLIVLNLLAYGFINILIAVTGC